MSDRTLAMLSSCVLLLACLQVAVGQPHPPFHLKCERNLVGLSQERLGQISKQLLFATDSPNPTFSWSLAHSQRGTRQTASRVLLAADAHLAAPTWDSGVVTGDSTSMRYEGPPLQSGTLYFWKVSWRDHEGRWAESEETGHFLTGVLRMQDWTSAKWITAPSSIPQAPLISKQLTVDSSQVASAVLYISGLGFFKVFVNGRDLNAYSDPPIALAPGWTNYEVRVPYSVYTVTRDVVESDILSVEVVLGIAWRNSSWYKDKDPPPPRPDSVERVLRAILNVTYINSTTVSFVTDDTWECVQSMFMHDSIYLGEVFDMQMKPGNPVKAVVTEGPFGAMYLPPIPPIVEAGEDTAVQIYKLANDPTKQIVDFANNSAGYCLINVKDLKAGESITLHHAEVPLHPPYGPMNGSLYYANLKSATQLDVFTSDGNSSIYQPSLTYHGFRYVEVSDYPRDLTAGDIHKIVVHTNLERNGHIQTSIPLLDNIQENCVRGQLSNLMSVPTDCCQRDERLGWMGDAGLSADSMALNFYMEAFHPHFVQLMVDELINGTVPDVVPFYRGGSRPADPSWGAAFPQFVWVLYKYYGNLDIAKAFFPGLLQYVDFLVSMISQSGIGKMYAYYGDWVPPPQHPKVNESFTSAFSFLNNVKQVHEIAVALNDTVNAAKLEQLFQEQSEAFNKAFLVNDQYLNGLQVTYVLPLYLGIVPTGIEAQLVNAFINQLKGSDQAHITAGIIGAKFILPVLTQLKQQDLAMEIVQQTSYPSWGFMIHNEYEPATTIWELWNSLNGSYTMDSRNHHMFSSVSGWMMTDMVGLHLPQGSYGFSDIHFHPARSLEPSQASVQLQHPKPLRLAWQRSGGIQCAKAAEDQSSLHPGLPKHAGLSVSCGEDSVIVDVLFASYGNPTGSCGYYKEGDCHAENSREVVEKLCMGQSSCHVPSGSDFWGELCSGSSKWLTVAVQCGTKDGGADYKYRQIQVEVSVPVGSKGTVFLPAHGKRHLQVWEGEEVVWDGGQVVSAVDGVLSWQWVLEEDSLMLELSSGSYQFTVRGQTPERKWAESKSEYLPLTCDAGHVISTINWASYGDSGLKWVGQEAEPVLGSCHAGCSQLAVERKCLGRQKCDIPVSSEFFGNSECTKAHLTVGYTCNKRP